MINKKAQIGETTTWIVATIVILVFVFLFIFASGLMAVAKPTLSLDADNAKEDHITQEMLFSILRYEADGREMIDYLAEAKDNGNYKEFESFVEILLERFEADGVKCNFYVYDLVSGVKSAGVEKGNNGIGEAKLEIGQLEVLLEC